MIDLNLNPEALLTAEQGDTFQLDGHTLVLEAGLTPEVFLTVTSGIAGIELLECPDGPYDWAHVRSTGNRAVMTRAALADLISTKQYSIS